MQESHQYLLQFCHFLSRCIWEYGDYLFVGLFYACVILVPWVMTRPRKTPRNQVRIIIVPQREREE